MNHQPGFGNPISPRGQRSYFGKYRGEAVNNRDPQGLGRLQVSVPAVVNGAPVWALPCVPYAGDGVGWFAMPPIGAKVWVEFEAGDLDNPIWSGCFWTGNQQVPGGGTSPEIKIFKTDKVTITVDDTAGTVEIETRGGSVLKLTATAAELNSTTITLESVFGKAVLSAAGVDINDGAFTVI